MVTFGLKENKNHLDEEMVGFICTDKIIIKTKVQFLYQLDLPLPA